MSTPKFLQTFFLALLIPICASAQQNVGIGTSSPAASAMLDVSSTNKGMLVPRLTTTQMNAIASPANGLLVYNTDSTAFAYRSGSAWVYLEGKSNASNDWSTKGNAGTSPATSFFGTTDDQDMVFKRNNVRAGLINKNSLNTSWGMEALNPASIGGYNTATGFNALHSNTEGFYNTATGVDALHSNIEGFYNTATGVGALHSNTEGSINTATGVYALRSNIEGFKNTATGGNALSSSTFGSFNTANGFDALFSNTTGFSNVAIGISSLFNNTNRSNLVAVGDSALYNNGVGATISFEASNNTAIGSKALFNNTKGYSNTALGAEALLSNTEGYYNTANGMNALYSNTTGNNNTANGMNALYSNTTGNDNTAHGLNALFVNTNGVSNTALGANALKANNTGTNNTAIGTRALELFNGSFFNNIAMGVDAMRNKTSGSNNVALGTGAMANNIIGGSNTAVGVDAGSSSTGSGNVFLGYTAGQNETGNNKLYISNDNSNSDNALIYGEFDNDRLQVNGTLGIGSFAGIYPLSVRAKSATHLLATFSRANGDPSFSLNLLENGTRLNFTDASNTSRLAIDDNGYIGMDKDNPIADLHIKEANDAYAPAGINNNGGIRLERASSTNSWNILADNSNDFDFNYNGVTKGYISHLDGSYTSLSDKRVKRNISPLTSVLSNVLLLEPKTYHYKDNNADAPLSYGFIAQEVEQLFPSFVDTKGPDGMKAIAYHNFSVVAVQAIKEQQVIIEAEKFKVKSLEDRVAKLEEMVKALMEK